MAGLSGQRKSSVHGGGEAGAGAPPSCLPGKLSLSRLVSSPAAQAQLLALSGACRRQSWLCHPEAVSPQGWPASLFCLGILSPLVSSGDSGARLGAPPRPELLLKPPPSRAPSLPPPHFKVTGTHHWGRGEVAGVLLLVRKPGPQVPGRPPPRASDLCAGLSAVARGCPAEDPHLPPAASPPLRLPTQ